MTEEGGWSLSAGELCLGGEGCNVGRVTECAEWDLSFLCFRTPKTRHTEFLILEDDRF
jgi:hypothetical protein